MNLKKTVSRHLYLRYTYKINFFWVIKQCYCALFLFVSGAIYAQDMRKVAVLEFVNETRDPNAQYLEKTISKAIKSKLAKEFVFEQANPREIASIARSSDLFHEDFSTRSVAMNIGKAAKQDVVISGGFSVDKSSEPGIVNVTVRIFDIGHRKMVAEFPESFPIDNNLFISINSMAGRIVNKAKSLLPTKTEWEKSGKKVPTGPWFRNWMLDTGIGGSLYMVDFADRLAPKLPSLRLALTTDIPILHENVTASFHGLYLSDAPIKEANPNISGLNINTNNYIMGFFTGYRFPVWSFSLHARLGFGYVLQMITVTGLRNADLTNGIGFMGMGLDVIYMINANLDVVLSTDAHLQMEEGKSTILGLTTLGMSYNLAY